MNAIIADSTTIDAPETHPEPSDVHPADVLRAGLMTHALNVLASSAECREDGNASQAAWYLRQAANIRQSIAQTRR